MKNGYIMIKTDTPDEKVGSILLADSAQKRPTTGTIVESASHSKGRRVMFFDNVGKTIQLEGVEFLVMKDDEIICDMGE